MKNLLLIILLIQSGTIFSQSNQILLKGDTLITISPKQLKQINLSFEKLIYFQTKDSISQKQIFLLNNQIQIKDTILKEKNNVILSYQELDSLKENQIKNLEKEIKIKSKRKLFNRIEDWIIGVSVGIITVIFIK